MTTVIGVLAAMLSVASFVPQSWRVIRTRKTEGLATMMWVINVVAFGLWTTYGAALRAWEIAVPNVICLGFSMFILAMKLAPSRTRHAIADALDPGGCAPGSEPGAIRHGEPPAAPQRESRS